MFRILSAIAVSLLFASSASAGVVIDVLPTQPGPYAPGERVELDVLFTQEPGGEDRYLRLLQVNIGNSDTALAFDDYLQFDFSAQSACALDPAACGVGYAQIGRIVFPEPPDTARSAVGVVYLGFSQDAELQLRLPADGAIPFGRLGVTLPTEPGDYVVDVLRANHPGIGARAQLQYGFGLDPEDPIVRWRPTTGDSLAGGMFVSSTTASEGFVFGYEPISGALTPEPATLVMLALGGGVLLRRRR